MAIGLILVLGIVLSWLKIAGAENGSPWATIQAPALTKTVDLPANVEPDASNTDCAPQTYTPSGKAMPETVCTFRSPLGILTTTGKIQTGTNSFVPLHGTDDRSIFLPTNDNTVALLSLPAPGIGNHIGIYRHLTKTMMHLTVENGSTFYQVVTPPDSLLRDPASGQPIEVNTTSIAYSANGQWMVVDVPHRGLLRVSMADMSTQLFAGAVEPDWYLGVADIALAVSNDGTYAAANTDVFGDGNITMYDLSSCSDQLDIDEMVRHYCTRNDVWHGQVPGAGLLTRQPGLNRPTHLRFINDDAISFSARYEVVSGTQYKAAQFVATAAGIPQHKIGLLGLGDSYISGQGAFSYRDGTDTQNDFCHLSELSYPFLLGRTYFNSYNSAACSGAKTDNVIGTDQQYKGQVRDGIAEYKRDKSSILANFLPGYLYQQEFASTYKPEAIMLSVGGDDVGFADIVKQCVANAGGGTCYDTYEDRMDLLNAINATYSKLVATYRTLRDQSGGARVYAVGYPQIVKAGGDCGLNVHLNASETAFATDLITYLDEVVRQAADTAGVMYVNTQDAFNGHRLCEASAGQSAMNGFTVGKDAGVTVRGHEIEFIGAESFHPTQLGYQLLGQTIAARTNGLHADMPAPQPYRQPAVDLTLPMLENLPQTGRKPQVVHYDQTMTDDGSVLRGSEVDLHIDSSEAQLQPISPYEVVLHSDPITIGGGTVDGAGTIDAKVTIPDTVPEGYHTLHIYAKNMAGEDVDMQKVVYVMSDKDEFGAQGNRMAASGAGGPSDVLANVSAYVSTVSPAPSSALVDRGDTLHSTDVTTVDTARLPSATLNQPAAVRTPANILSAIAPLTTVPASQVARLNWGRVVVYIFALVTVTAVLKYVRHR